ncbi:MAG: hypothetical protein UW63_C0031G0010 [Candidatus Uhrbacteria bacterium GW2011_GWF2_44_350]|uniref:Uncharacterized protein n=1 Tax=Candidatus Uhrbacteria bacterium GW2011_GWF2_44_350 TaxID=1619000 RepID=A0A0G1LN95_9BACT|nr:MAG: hypothetical protein UW63_C0031G0010 [Candidatus Uhrbacteria bacterium GW2011_GWF2_44_350]
MIFGRSRLSDNVFVTKAGLIGIDGSLLFVGASRGCIQPR